MISEQKNATLTFDDAVDLQGIVSVGMNSAAFTSIGTEAVVKRKTDNNGYSSTLKLYTFMDFPIELLVCIISFVTSARHKIKLRNVSLRIRAAVEVYLA